MRVPLMFKPLVRDRSSVLASSSSDKLQTLLDTLIDEGKQYGLELNWKKKVLMKIRNAWSIQDPSGKLLTAVDQAEYLGGTYAKTGGGQKCVQITSKMLVAC